MSLWSIIEGLFDWLSWLRHWRFNLCLYGGFFLAVAAVAKIPFEPLKWIAAVVILIAAIVFGWRWDDSD